MRAAIVGASTPTTRGDDRNDWLEQAACRGMPHWHYGNVWEERNESEYDGDVNADALDSAVARCRECPVLLDCRRTVREQEHGQPLELRFGITAALTPYERWVKDGMPAGETA